MKGRSMEAALELDTDLQALVRLIRAREEDFRQLEADCTHERFGARTLRVVAS